MYFCFSILTYNRSESLLALLNSIYELNFPSKAEFCIYIWDNGSSVEHYNRLRSENLLQKSEINYFYSSKNSFMKAKCYLEDIAVRNFDSIKDSFLVHLDDDVQLTPDWLVNSWNNIVENGFDASGSVENWNGDIVYSGQKELNFQLENSGDREIKVWRWEWQKIVSAASSIKVNFAGHRALMVKMEAAVSVKHDPQLLIGGEDIDYSLSLCKAGYSIGIPHNAMILHRALNEVDAAGFRTYDKVVSSWQHFYKKWGFVRGNAASEAGLSQQEWLNLIVNG